MSLLPSILAVLLLILAAESASQAYTPIVHILLNCGSSSTVTSPDNRIWQADADSKFAGNLSSSVASQASDQDPSISQLPYYYSARLSLSEFTYSFPVSAASALLRLYFYPHTYSDHRDTSSSFFSVTANGHLLLKNFSAQLSLPTTVVAFFREYVISSGDKNEIELRFVPDDGYAFVNAIEIVSIPENLYTRVVDEGYTNVGLNTMFYFYNSSTALETVYRVNVGGSDVDPFSDTGMFRTWQQDDEYSFQKGVIAQETNLTIDYSYDLTPPYTAPEAVYKTSRVMGNHSAVNLNFNLSWIFPVDSGFSYLVRLHFCETQPEIDEETYRVFNIYVNNQTAEKQFDVISLTHGNGIPVTRDYVVFVPPANQKRQDLWIELHPYFDALTKPKIYDAILNGVEVFKINSSAGSLAGEIPDPPVTGIALPPPGRKSGVSSKPHLPMTAGIAGGFAGVAVVLGLLCFFIFRRRNRKSRLSHGVSMWDPFSSTTTKSTGSSLPSDLCRHFTINEIKAATDNFDPVLIVGAGGFGNVYKGRIDGGMTPVAIKRLNPESRQGAHEFVTEIEMLSRLRHLHLVSLIGYCVDNNEMILVYDYMSRGTLRDHLYNTDNPPLTWIQRLEICIGAASGLHYLHTGAKHTIIHRDVKTTNILLDDKWVAKVSDFGLSRMGSTDVSKAHVSTVVKGSIGYLDPEYARCEQLTEKSDVYSFGVVLCEVISSRPPTIRTAEPSRVSLAEWARRSHRDGSFDPIVDKNLMAEIAPECLLKYGQIAIRCLHFNAIGRPSMAEVLGELEFVLQLQCTAEERIREGGPVMEMINGQEASVFGGKWSADQSHTSESSSGQSFSGNSVDSNPLLLTSSGVFSEISNPTAR